jgi:hypothetical protein
MVKKYHTPVNPVKVKAGRFMIYLNPVVAETHALGSESKA